MTEFKFNQLFDRRFREAFNDMFDIAFSKAHQSKSDGPYRHARPVAVHDNWEARIARLEQFHCDHEFGNREKGCLDGIFCSKCGVLHPDWEPCDHFAWSSEAISYINEDGSKYEPELTIDGQDYRRKKGAKR